MNNRVKISQIIKADYQELLHTLEQFAETGVDVETYAQLKHCLDRMSAGHFAEELTLYELTDDIALIDSHYFTGYHAMLDNLYESIRNGGHLSEALIHELKVLCVLTRIHYSDEEELILPVVEEHLEYESSVEMAAKYQRSVSVHCQ